MNPRTDLAVEKQEQHRLTPNDGVTEEHEDIDGISVTRVRVYTPEAAETLGKDMGDYVTVEFDGTFTDNEKNLKAAEVVANELKKLVKPENGVLLAVGLGNSALTADALGPQTVDGLIVTHHLKEYAPQIYESLNLGDVTAICPGVLSKTGIESSDLVKSAVEKVKPEVVVIIDALAARHMKRLCGTVQISNTGICPGAGVGNNRTELSEKTLGTRVVSVGIPTVVDAATLTSDAVEAVGQKLNIGEISYESVRDALTPYEMNMIVTPKDIDALTSKCATLLSEAINRVFHGNLSAEEIASLKA